jgi:Tfp pilus assembly protein PilZ
MSDTRFEDRKLRKTVTDLISGMWDEPVPMIATDVSPAGLFIPTDILLEPGEVVVACFNLPGHFQEFQLFGEVAWVALPRRADDPIGPAGMGIKFVKSKPIERMSIRASIRGLPAPLPYKVRATHWTA